MASLLGAGTSVSVSTTGYSMNASTQIANTQNTGQSLSGGSQDGSPGVAGSPHSSTVVGSPDQSPSPTTMDERRGDQTSSQLPSGLHRTKARSTSSARDAASPLKSKPEKRKRNRVTPEQLVELEATFAKERSPTAGVRREMSLRLGMSERAVQIWFQNRRAKAKHQDQRVIPPTNNPNPVPLEHWPPEDPPALSVAPESDLAELLNESEPITIFPCLELCIGTWRRVRPANGRDDLVAYWAEQSHSLNWFIHSSGLCFKMEVPIAIVRQIKMFPTSPGFIAVHFDTIEPPTFFIQQPRTIDGLPNHLSRRFPSLNVAPGEWATCRDWTEDNQASKVFRHILIGRKDGLLSALRRLPASYGLFDPPAQASVPTYPESAEQRPRTSPNQEPYPQVNGYIVPPLQPPRLVELRNEGTMSAQELHPPSSIQLQTPQEMYLQGRQRSASDPTAFMSQPHQLSFSHATDSALREVILPGMNSVPTESSSSSSSYSSTIMDAPIPDQMAYNTYSQGNYQQQQQQQRHQQQYYEYSQTQGTQAHVPDVMNFMPVQQIPNANQMSTIAFPITGIAEQATPVESTRHQISHSSHSSIDSYASSVDQGYMSGYQNTAMVTTPVEQTAAQNQLAEFGGINQTYQVAGDINAQDGSATAWMHQGITMPFTGYVYDAQGFAKNDMSQTMVGYVGY